MFERAEIFHALDRTATVIGDGLLLLQNPITHLCTIGNLWANPRPPITWEIHSLHLDHQLFVDHPLSIFYDYLLNIFSLK
jgi:hypothetical protein